jgi:hypothetical protein
MGVATISGRNLPISSVLLGAARPLLGSGFVQSVVAITCSSADLCAGGGDDSMIGALRKSACLRGLGGRAVLWKPTPLWLSLLRLVEPRSTN